MCTTQPQGALHRSCTPSSRALAFRATVKCCHQCGPAMMSCNQRRYYTVNPTGVARWEHTNSAPCRAFIPPALTICVAFAPPSHSRFVSASTQFRATPASSLWSSSWAVMHCRAHESLSLHSEGELHGPLTSVIPSWAKPVNLSLSKDNWTQSRANHSTNVGSLRSQACTPSPITSAS